MLIFVHFDNFPMAKLYVTICLNLIIIAGGVFYNIIKPYINGFKGYTTFKRSVLYFSYVKYEIQGPKLGHLTDEISIADMDIHIGLICRNFRGPFIKLN